MREPSVYFFVAPELKRHFQANDDLATAMALFPTRAGEIAHVVQTCQLLSSLGVQTKLVDTVPTEGIVVCHRRSFPPPAQISENVFVVSCKGDWPVHEDAHLHVIQNPNDMGNLDPALWPTHYIPHYPQPNLRSRSKERGDTFVNIAYVGDVDNLAPELQNERFREDLCARGLQWHIQEHALWHDYSTLDAIVAVRRFTRDDPFIEKPATKLFNAWHAQVPAILGAESGYRTHKTSEWDYIEVSTYGELLSALERLRDDAGLRRRIKVHAEARAPEVTAQGIALLWREFLVSVATPAYMDWRRLTPQERARFRHRRSVRSGERSWIKTHPDSPVRNSQMEGIGRIEAFGNTVVINNLGRNIETCHFENGGLHRPSFYQETAYPDHDELSQFDLDMHAFLMSPDRRHLLALNHHGLVRVFEMPAFRHVRSLQWYGDVERTVLIDGCLIGTSPNGFATEDPARDGIVIGKSWEESNGRISFSFELSDWGKVSAIAQICPGNALAIAAGQRLGLFSVKGAAISSLLWQIDLPFAILWIKDNPAQKKILVAGDSPFAVLDADSGRLLQQFRLTPALAWGNGAVPLTLAHDQLIGADRLGGIYSWSLKAEDSDSASPKTLLTETAAQPLGFAHMAISGNHVLCGYNRGGYKILCAPLPNSTSSTDPSPRIPTASHRGH